MAADRRQPRPREVSRRLRTIATAGDVVVFCPSDEAWDVVQGVADDQRWRTGLLAIEVEPGGPVTSGTIIRERYRFAGLVHDTEGLVTAVAPGTSFEWRAVRGPAAHGGRRVVPLGPDRALVTVWLQVRVASFEVLVAPWIRRTLQRSLDADLRRLAELLGRTPAPPERPALP